jgi:hypothetical protein
MKKFLRVITEVAEADMCESTVLHDDRRLEDVTPERVSKALVTFSQPNPAYSEVKAPTLSFFADDFWPDLIPNENREKATIVFDGIA